MSGTVYWEVVFVSDAGALMCRPKLAEDLAKFCRVWDRNIREQGFITAASFRGAA